MWFDAGDVGCIFHRFVKFDWDNSKIVCNGEISDTQDLIFEKLPNYVHIIYGIRSWIRLLLVELLSDVPFVFFYDW